MPNLYDDYLPPDIDKMPVLEQLRARRTAAQTAINQLQNRKASGLASESRGLDSALSEGQGLVKAMDERIAELEEQETRESRAAAHRVELGITEPGTGGSGWSVGSEASPYRRDGSMSFFRDLAQAQTRGDHVAAERIARNTAIVRESRAVGLGDLGVVAGSGGEVAPPAWLQESFVALARPGRVAADLFTSSPLPQGVSSLNIPKVSAGVTVGVQQTNNTALSDTAAQTTSLTSGITTVGGKQIISNQLIAQTPGNVLDRIIMGDLAKAYGAQLDNQVLYGSGTSGQLRGLSGVANVNTFTTATPAFQSTTLANNLYAQILKAQKAIAVGRFGNASAVLMHPQVWLWIAEAADTAGRPFMSAAGSFNSVVTSGGENVAQGTVGSINNVPVYTDANLSLTVSANQTEVYVLGPREDFMLWETQPAFETFNAPYADDNATLFRVVGYAAAIPDRYSASIQVIRGTGLLASAVTP